MHNCATDLRLEMQFRAFRRQLKTVLFSRQRPRRIVTFCFIVRLINTLTYLLTYLQLGGVEMWQNLDDIPNQTSNTSNSHVFCVRYLPDVQYNLQATLNICCHSVIATRTRQNRLKIDAVKLVIMSSSFLSHKSIRNSVTKAIH